MMGKLHFGFVSTFVIAVLPMNVFCQCNTDVFGIAQFYPSAASSREWTSAHWNNGVSRNIKYASDPYDPTDWTEDHSGGTNGFQIDGNGVMSMSGSSPRFHINSLRTNKVAAQFYLNVEFTAYYRRVGSTGANYGGMVVGTRSAPLGHASSGGNDCDATTYYARFRNDGKWDFEKELKHPNSDYWSGSGFHTQDPLWAGNTPLPQNKWIGMKYIITNIENNTKVRLEVYIDSTSNGNPVNGGNWKKVGEVIDAGSWPAASSNITGCSYTDPTTVILQGHGTLLLRTDGDQADYKMVSVREIDTSVPSSYPCITTATSTPSGKSNLLYFPNPTKDKLSIHRAGDFKYEVYDVAGKLVEIGAGKNTTNVGTQLPSGIYLILIHDDATIERFKFVKE
jgi:hypothetical protein